MRLTKLMIFFLYSYDDEILLCTFILPRPLENENLTQNFRNFMSKLEFLWPMASLSYKIKVKCGTKSQNFEKKRELMR